MKIVYSKHVGGWLCSLTHDDGQVILIDGIYAEVGGKTKLEAKRELQEKIYLKMRKDYREALDILNVISNSK